MYFKDFTAICKQVSMTKITVIVSKNTLKYLNETKNYLKHIFHINVIIIPTETIITHFTLLKRPYILPKTLQYFERPYNNSKDLRIPKKTLQCLKIPFNVLIDLTVF